VTDICMYGWDPKSGTSSGRGFGATGEGLGTKYTSEAEALLLSVCLMKASGATYKSL